MQWLIDIIADRILQNFSGMILQWSGAIVDIPDGWFLCDGSNDTPDLRNQFVVGAGDTYNPDDSGGSVDHDHTFTSDFHAHSLAGVMGVQTGVGLGSVTTSAAVPGTTDDSDNLPPFYSLAYIMKS